MCERRVKLVSTKTRVLNFSAIHLLSRKEILTEIFLPACPGNQDIINLTHLNIITVHTVCVLLDITKTETLALSLAHFFQKSFILNSILLFQQISCMIVESAVYGPMQPLLRMITVFQVSVYGVQFVRWGIFSGANRVKTVVLEPQDIASNVRIYASTVNNDQT